MSYIIRLKSEINALEWDSLVAAAGQGGYFALTPWLNGVESIGKWNLKDYSFAVLNNNRFCAVVPLHWDEKNKSLLSSGWGWSGPIFLESSKKLSNLVFDYIDGLALSLKAKSVKLGMQGVVGELLNNNGINPWVYYGYNDISSHTQILKLQNKTVDELWMDLSQTARQTIKKAEKSCYVELVDWKEHLENYYALHKLTYQKSKLQPHPFAYFNLITNLSKDNHKLFAVFNQNKEVLAYHNDLYYKKTVFYHTASSSDYGNTIGAHYLLTWNAIKFAKENNCEFYEFGEVVFDNNTKAQQISFFKTRFGGELYRLYRAEKKYIPSPKKDAFIKCLRSVKNFTLELIRF